VVTEASVVFKVIGCRFSVGCLGSFADTAPATLIAVEQPQGFFGA